MGGRDGGDGVSFTRPSSEVPFAVNPNYARHEMTSPPEVAACCRACALTCGCHCASVSSAKAAWRRFCGFVAAPER